MLVKELIFSETTGLEPKTLVKKGLFLEIPILRNTF